MPEYRIVKASDGGAFGVLVRYEHVPTGAHSEGPVGVALTTTDSKGWRSAFRSLAAELRGKRPGQIKLVAYTQFTGLDGQGKVRAWYL